MNILESLNLKMQNITDVDNYLLETMYSFYEDIYIDVSKKQKDNRDKYFSMQNTVIWLTGVVSIINVIATIVASYKNISYLIPIFTGLATIVATLLTVISVKIKFKKYLEIWLRHQSTKAALEFEMSKYILNTHEYSQLNEENSLNLFKENFIHIIEDNQRQFNLNMSRFESE